MVQILIEGMPRLDSQLLTNMPSGVPENAGAQSAIMGTIWVISVTAAFTIPVGIGAAVYLEEYANKERRWNRFIELNLQNLAAVPVDRLRNPRTRLSRPRPLRLRFRRCSLRG